MSILGCGYARKVDEFNDAIKRYVKLKESSNYVKEKRPYYKHVPKVARRIYVWLAACTFIGRGSKLGV